MLQEGQVSIDAVFSFFLEKMRVFIKFMIVILTVILICNWKAYSKVTIQFFFRNGLICNDNDDEDMDDDDDEIFGNPAKVTIR